MDNTQQGLEFLKEKRKAIRDVVQKIQDFGANLEERLDLDGHDTVYDEECKDEELRDIYRRKIVTLAWANRTMHRYIKRYKELLVEVTEWIAQGDELEPYDPVDDFNRNKQPTTDQTQMEIAEQLLTRAF